MKIYCEGKAVLLFVIKSLESFHKLFSLKKKFEKRLRGQLLD